MAASSANEDYLHKLLAKIADTYGVSFETSLDLFGNLRTDSVHVIGTNWFEEGRFSNQSLSENEERMVHIE